MVNNKEIRIVGYHFIGLPSLTPVGPKNRLVDGCKCRFCGLTSEMVNKLEFTQEVIPYLDGCDPVMKMIAYILES